MSRLISSSRRFLTFVIISTCGLITHPRDAVSQNVFAMIEQAAPAADGETRVFFGQVAAKQTVDLAFQVGGQIVDLPIDEGAKIEQGALVAQLDLEPFELAFARAEEEEEQAGRTLNRFEKLEGRTVSEVAVDDAQTMADLAAIAVRDAKRSLNDATLHSPFDGIIASRLVSNFSTISAGTPIARIHDMSYLRVEVDVPEIFFQNAVRDPSVTAHVQFPGNPETYRVVLREFNAETASVGQTYSITVGMEPPEGLYVLPGSSAKVTVTFNKGAKQRVTVPATAVLIDANGGTSVMVFEPADAESGTVKVVEVEVAPTTFGEIEIVSGLEPGQEYVAMGGNKLTDGQTVNRFAGFGE